MAKIYEDITKTIGNTPLVRSKTAAARSHYCGVKRAQSSEIKVHHGTDDAALDKAALVSPAGEDELVELQI